MRTGNMQSRRDFLKSGGALMVSFSTAALTLSPLMAQGPFDTHPSHIPDRRAHVGAAGAVGLEPRRRPFCRPNEIERFSGPRRGLGRKGSGLSRRNKREGARER